VDGIDLAAWPELQRALEEPSKVDRLRSDLKLLGVWARRKATTEEMELLKERSIRQLMR
jgi:hypothetical protein